jgi:hypothetical protein
MSGGNEVERSRRFPNQGGSLITTKNQGISLFFHRMVKIFVVWMWQPVAIELDARSIQIRHAKITGS